MSRKNPIVKNTAYVVFLISVLMIIAAACSAADTASTPISTSTEVAVDPTETVAPVQLPARAEQILALAEGRGSYYDKDFIYLDLQDFRIEDIPVCSVAFWGLVLNGQNESVFDQRGLATFVGDNHEYVIVPQPLVPSIPEDTPEQSFSTWSKFTTLMSERYSNAVGEGIILSNFRVVIFNANDQLHKDRIFESIPSACEEVVVGDSSLLSPLDVLIVVGLAGETDILTKENVAFISGRVKAISQENHGFYFDGTILPYDMGGLVFALHLGRPELVGIVTGANWTLGYETQNFATNFDEIVEELEKIKTPE